MKENFTCIEQPEIRKKLISRINRIAGQIRGIEKMIDNNSECDDILNQISSVKSALNGIAKLVLEVHLRSCVVNDIKLGQEEEAVGTLIKILDDFIYKNNKKCSDSNEKIIRKIEKQISNIQNSLTKDECCSSILKTVAMVKVELNAMAKVILENHIKNCLVNEIKMDNQDKMIDDFLYTVNKMMK